VVEHNAKRNILRSKADDFEFRNSLGFQDVGKRAQAADRQKPFPDITPLSAKAFCQSWSFLVLFEYHQPSTV
jgi:hypothetical protein